MKRYSLILVLFFFTLSNLFAQSNEIKKVTYVKTEIDIPLEYSSKNEFSIENNKFSAEWVYLPSEIIEQDLGKEIFKQLEGQVDYDKMVDIEFISNGNKFSGKNIHLKVSSH